MLPHSDDTGVSPVCADPVWLPYVDAAFARPGGPEAALLSARACYGGEGCPLRVACLSEAMAGPEHGPWAGTSANKRSRLGGLSAHTYTNTAGYRRAAA